MTISIGRKPGISLRDSGAKYVLNKIQNFSGCLGNASAKDSAENFAYQSKIRKLPKSFFIGC